MIKILKAGKVKPPTPPQELPRFEADCDECGSLFDCNRIDMYPMFRAGAPTRYTVVCPLTGCSNVVTIKDAEEIPFERLFGLSREAVCPELGIS